MTSQQIQYMIQSGMLFLDKKRKNSHYDAAYTIRYVSLIPAVLSIYFLFKQSFANWGSVLIFCFISTGIFLLVSLLIFKVQEAKLKFISFSTHRTKADNYLLSLEVLQILKWNIGQNSPDFIEAYNPNKDMRTWGNEMISILLLDNKILLNSICNLDLMNQSFLSLGKNEQNVAKFIDSFKVIAQSNKLQSA